MKDNDAGVLIGKILETARVLNKPVFLMVTTDGAVSSTKSDSYTSSYNSDRGSGSSIHVYMYDPNSRPVTSDFQVGHFTKGQTADTSFVTGGNPSLATQAVFLNWLKLNNKMDLYSQIVPVTGLSASQISQVVKVG